MSNVPVNVLVFLHSRFGTITNEQSLFGVAGHGVIQLKFANGITLIVKSSPSSRERSFYETQATLLRHVGVRIPDLYWSGSDHDGQHWIVIEDIPNPFPQERWRCDPQQIEMLVRLHAETWNNRRQTLAPDAYTPSWDNEMTRRASEWFAEHSERQHVSNQLTMLQWEAQVLFQPLCSISADPNPTNWRIRDSGELVLLDWERFSQGHPAIDLAITMPGLGSESGVREAQLASLYRKCWERDTGSVPSELNHLDRMIRLAKVWSAVEFIAGAVAKSGLYPAETVDYIVGELPGHMDELNRD